MTKSAVGVAAIVGYNQRRIKRVADMMATRGAKLDGFQLKKNMHQKILNQCCNPNGFPGFESFNNDSHVSSVHPYCCNL
ncbi:hypothetical protein TNCV_2671811 [Trichonephila clavipes]|nr:hypothetical protein TNCV_2671811 [Trichonephila clavipes]